MEHYLVVGLGNIGAEYQHTRHNIGFMVVDHLAKALSAEFQHDRYAFLAYATYRGRKLLLLKPTTYMNLSGKAVSYYVLHHKIALERLMVITDDIALPFGTLRVRPKGSDGGHNGLRHIQECLQTQQYPRLRIGIGSHFPKGSQVDYVLGRFSEEESKALPIILDASKEAILAFVFHGLQYAMNHFNKSVVS